MILIVWIIFVLDIFFTILILVDSGSKSINQVEPTATSIKYVN
jgi:hypothetical protein